MDVFFCECAFTYLQGTSSTCGSLHSKVYSLDLLELPGSIVEATEGFLKKKPDSGLGRWQYRYFRLDQNGLSYWNTQALMRDEIAPKHTFALDKCESVKLKTSNPCRITVCVRKRKRRTTKIDLLAPYPRSSVVWLKSFSTYMNQGENNCDHNCDTPQSPKPMLYSTLSRLRPTSCSRQSSSRNSLVLPQNNTRTPSPVLQKSSGPSAAVCMMHTLVSRDENSKHTQPIAGSIKYSSPQDRSSLMPIVVDSVVTQ